MFSLKWGPITWLLFHSLTAKIKPEYFNEERSRLISHIKAICGVLPCPLCAEHAQTALKNIDKVQTKEQLQHYLFNFHNEVNSRKRVTIPDISILEQYKTMDLNKILHTWIRIFKLDSGVTQFMNLRVIRDKTKHSFINYMQTNFHKYN
tara:strand:+ start:444 stop:890 length:447 start_codon:yes stop_codon:yes gene_type:complete